MQLIKRFSLIVPLIVLCLNTKAQDKIISGTVFSGEDNKPLQGVTVSNKNTKKSTLTNSVGYFSIAAEIGHVLTISYVGFAPRTITIADYSMINLTIQQTTW
jgi:hypothetical protein